ncbi:MAG: VOC family protein [Methanomassiliicoccales archaeon]
MPLGDPMGGNEDYRERGKITGLEMVMIPVSDIEEGVEFYNGVLGFEIVSDLRRANWIELKVPGCGGKIALYGPPDGKERTHGIHTGIVLGTDSIYELHRRLVDEGVNFVMKPTRQPWGGLMAAFVDQDGNEIAILETAISLAKNK